MSERIVKIGIIGLGARAETLLACIFEMTGIEVAAICDINPQKIEKINSIFDKRKIARPRAYDNYMALLDDPDVEALFVPTSWNSHLTIACECMKRGKYVGIEVGGASSIEELWQLVHASESTGVSCMMLENCCYGRNELMVLNMVRQGLFGELIYCECGYEHDISEMAWANESGRRLERALHNQYRNGDLYPTHGIGPIAKILGINRGNRFLTISSHATKARGFVSAQEAHTGKAADKLFREGDVVTSVIHCANGENITLTHCVSLPRPYTRNCRVQGTKGIWLENADGIFVDGISKTEVKIDIAGNPYITHAWDKVESLYEKYDHPIWKEFRENVIGGHGGMDALAMNAFLGAVRRKVATPIDVYDVAAWMSITCLSEQSIALGGMPVPFPDFTNGKWIDREPEEPSKWSLN